MNKTLARLSSEMEPADAEMLSDAGYRTPYDIKAATNGDLLKINGLGPVALKRIRAIMPKVKGKK